VNFNGTSTVAIRASFNVTSITDNGTGDYTVNFTTSMPDANYSLATNSPNTSGNNPLITGKDNGTAFTTTACRVGVNQQTTRVDSADVTVAIFR
jgi:hypothetical protein